ncbi:hypothetical protein [Anaerosolibacter sp.]|uniref:hypothetical protein n=1 Tax=Anaerosolibacter sp. TaxID=1872527 RepID=UPI0039F093FA
MNEKRPFIITFIGDGCILGAFFFLLSLFPNLLESFGVYIEPLPVFLKFPFLTESLMRVLIAMILLLVSYGYFRLMKWGYWLLIILNMYYLIGWFIAAQQSNQEYYYQNPISLIIGLIFIVPTIKYFNEKSYNA